MWILISHSHFQDIGTLHPSSAALPRHPYSVLDLWLSVDLDNFRSEIIPRQSFFVDRPKGCPALRLLRAPVRRQPQVMADGIADVGLKEPLDALPSAIAGTKVLARGCVYLWVRVDIANALDVNDQQVVAGVLVREVGEGLGGVPVVRGAPAVVVVVLGERPRQVRLNEHDALVSWRRSGPDDKEAVAEPDSLGGLQRVERAGDGGADFVHLHVTPDLLLPTPEAWLEYFCNSRPVSHGHGAVVHPEGQAHAPLFEVPVLQLDLDLLLVPFLGVAVIPLLRDRLGVMIGAQGEVLLGGHRICLVGCTGGGGGSYIGAGQLLQVRSTLVCRAPLVLISNPPSGMRRFCSCDRGLRHGRLRLLPQLGLQLGHLVLHVLVGGVKLQAHGVGA
mmetsp:Transcript_22701/g.40784  ORF Transcript_22701/g.40784 Transcript_22701/m.40784 type:complete len:389 (+) Transcript_22701:1078-2244(+)